MVYIAFVFIVQVEMKSMIKADQNGHFIADPNERTAMLQSHSQFDMASASMAGETFMDEPRYSTLGRQRPVIIAPQPHRDGMFSICMISRLFGFSSFCSIDFCPVWLLFLINVAP